MKILHHPSVIKVVRIWLCIDKKDHSFSSQYFLILFESISLMFVFQLKFNKGNESSVLDMKFSFTPPLIFCIDHMIISTGCMKCHME